MKIVALCGKGSTGKTSTIKHLLEILNPAIAPHQNLKPECILSNYQKLGNEFRLLLHYKGKTVGFTSLGEGSTYLQSSFNKILKWSENNPPYIIVCAIHNTDSQRITLRKYAQASDIFEIPKVSAPSISMHDLENYQSAHQILNTLNTLIEY